ncbi:15505_t:CDS:2, partial [Gigaspora margarita]
MYNVQENVELEREVEQPVIELEQLGEPLYVELEQRVELYDFSGPVDPLFYIEEPNLTGEVYNFDEIIPYFNEGIKYFNEENHHFDEESPYSNHNIEHSVSDELIYVGEPTIPSTSNNPLANLNYESGLNSNGEKQRHRCHNHQCTYQSKHYYEMKRHWKRKHEDIVEIPTPDKIFTNLANGKRTVPISYWSQSGIMIMANQITHFYLKKAVSDWITSKWILK